MVGTRSSLVLACLTVALLGCRADREALDPPGGEPVDLSPDPRIEAAPATPTRPVGAPVGIPPDTAPRDTVDLDTVPEADVYSPAAPPPGGP